MLKLIVKQDFAIVVVFNTNSLIYNGFFSVREN